MPINEHEIQPGNVYYNPNYSVIESYVGYSELTLLLWQEMNSNFVSRSSPGDGS